MRSFTARDNRQLDQHATFTLRQWATLWVRYLLRTHSCPIEDTRLSWPKNKVSK